MHSRKYEYHRRNRRSPENALGSVYDESEKEDLQSSVDARINISSAGEWAAEFEGTDLPAVPAPARSPWRARIYASRALVRGHH